MNKGEMIIYNDLLMKINNLEKKSLLFENERIRLNEEYKYNINELNNKYNSKIEIIKSLEFELNNYKKEIVKNKENNEIENNEKNSLKSQLNKNIRELDMVIRENKELKQNIYKINKNNEEKEFEINNLKNKFQIEKSNFDDLKLINKESMKNLNILKLYNDEIKLINKEYELKLKKFVNNKKNLANNNNKVKSELIGINLNNQKENEQHKREILYYKQLVENLEKENNRLNEKIYNLSDEKDRYLEISIKLRNELDIIKKENEIAVNLIDKN